MNSVDTTAVLNRLHSLHRYSLASYLNYAKPWPLRGDEAAREVMSHIVPDQLATADRIADLIMENGGDVAGAEYPMYFTGFNDLSYDYLIKQLILHQKQDVTAIEQCVKQLSLVPYAKALAEESLGAAKGYLDSLVELTDAAARPSGS